MKYGSFLLLGVLLVLSACGLRGSLNPAENDDRPYPRQYPLPDPT
ncbi:MAG: lipoprotein [Holosporaceae bacterium]|nr:lipoprotein [Holosporaceae bacterium]